MPCLFCQIVNHSAPAHIIYEDDKFLAFLDKHPQTLGHTQLVPKKHYTWVYEIPNIGEFFTTAALVTRGIIKALNADHVSYATFGHEVKHAHLWIVPQYKKSVQLVEGRHTSVEAGAELAEVLRKAISIL